MSTGYGWEGIRQVCTMLLGARNVPERLCSGSVYLRCYNKCLTFILFYMTSWSSHKHIIMTLLNPGQFHTTIKTAWLTVVIWLSGNMVGLISEVTLHRAGLVLRW